MDNGTAERGAEPSLADWTRRLARGDEEAWGWFHERYYLPLLRYAAVRSNPSAASEVVQLAYLRVARHARLFDDEAAFWRWLCCLVRCAAVDHGRHVTRRAILLEKFAHWRTAQSGDGDCPPSAGDGAALAEEALAKLPEEDAALLRRKYYEGCSTGEIAAALGATPKAIENRLARLRERLREIILRIR